jgi:hypothetical protein
MMDIVGALNFYRTSVVDDQAKFEILHFLYMDGFAEEEKLEALTGLDKRTFKAAVREMYQANLVKPKGTKGLELTSFAEATLTRMGADKTVAALLIDDVVAASSAKRFHALANWTLNFEPDRARTATQSLRNLKTYLIYKKELSERQRHNLLFTCLSPAHESRTQVALKAAWTDFEFGFVTYFAGHGASHDKSVLRLVVDEHKHWVGWSDKIDMVIVDTCKSVTGNRSVARDVIPGISFRIFNYLKGDAPDYVVESAISKVPSSNSPLWDAIWVYLEPIIHTHGAGGYGKTALANDVRYTVRNSRDLCQAVVDTVNIKTGRHQGGQKRHVPGGYMVLEAPGRKADEQLEIRSWMEEN